MKNPGAPGNAVIERMRITSSGNVGIGVSQPAHLLHVAGVIGAEQIIVSSTGADYVFDPGYALMPLDAVADFIGEHHHLVDANGPRPWSDPLLNGAGCTQWITVQECYKRMISTGPNNWVSQGVTGIRFFFGMAGGYYSTPFDANGNLQATWKQNLQLFLADLASYGIQRVTPTPVWDAWTASGSLAPFLCTDENVLGCKTPPAPDGSRRSLVGEYPERTECGDHRYKFYAWLPYGFVTTKNSDNTDNDVFDQGCASQTYSLSPQNNYNFWGWDRFLNMMEEITVLARCGRHFDDPVLPGTNLPCDLSQDSKGQPVHPPNLALDAWDYFQESNLADFTIQARVIYDPYLHKDVLGEIDSRMAKHGFDAQHGLYDHRVAPSANEAQLPTPNGPSAPMCNNERGDSVTLSTLSELRAAIAGERFGTPAAASGGCGGSATDPTLDQIAVSHAQRTFIDMHVSVGNDHFPSLNDEAVFGQAHFSRFWDFLVKWGFTSDPLHPPKVMFGEFNPVDNSGCSPFTYQQADAYVNGTATPGGGYVNSTLFSQGAQTGAANVVIRQWYAATGDNQCTPGPSAVNPPYKVR